MLFLIIIITINIKISENNYKSLRDLRRFQSKTGVKNSNVSKKVMEVSDGNTSYDWCTPNGPQGFGKGSGKVGNRSTNIDNKQMETGRHGNKRTSREQQGSKKRHKHLDLARKLKKSWNMKVTVVLRSTCILRIVLDTWGDLLFLGLQ